MAEELTRKRRVRGGHRASATRTISSVIKILSARDVARINEHAVKLTQQSASLEGKLSSLEELDAEVLAIVPEDKIEDKIERADLLKENIQLFNALSPAGVSFDLALQNVSGSSPVNRNENGTSPSSPPSVEVNSVPSTSKTLQVKLPKLELRKFDGNHTQWISFRDTFEASVHNNASLSAIDKFSYLRSLLERSAADAISGLILMASNYKEAIEILKASFGNKQQIINCHM